MLAATPANDSLAAVFAAKTKPEACAPPSAPAHTRRRPPATRLHGDLATGLPWYTPRSTPSLGTARACAHSPPVPPRPATPRSITPCRRKARRGSSPSRTPHNASLPSAMSSALLRPRRSNMRFPRARLLPRPVMSIPMHHAYPLGSGASCLAPPVCVLAPPSTPALKLSTPPVPRSPPSDPALDCGCRASQCR